MQSVSRPLPPAAQFILTKPVPCGLLMLFMFSAQLWLPQLFSSLPVLVLFIVMLAMALNFFTPALAGLVAIGGGAVFAAQAGGLAALLVSFIPGVNIGLALVFAFLYVLIPAIAARALLSSGGMTRSSDVLIIGATLATIVTLVAINQTQDMSAHAWVNHLLQPLFGVMSERPDALPSDALQSIQTLLGWVLPGMLALSLWFMWGINLVFARKVATYYGFYTGDPRAVLHFQPAIWSGGLLFISLLAANFAGGDVQYMGVTVALFISGVLAFNGVSVVHLWLRSRALAALIVLMYFMLMFWSMMILPFIMLGMLDLWFNYRNKISDPADAA